MMKEASYYTFSGGTLTCRLCPHECDIKDGHTGICHARRRLDDSLYSENYGILTAVNLDPIEKKPLRMYKPGSKILSAGSYGCNFKCGFCQNSSISQHILKSEYVSPEALALEAYRLKDSGNIGIAYTYNEPSVMYEYVYDTSVRLKREYGMDNVLVTNGYISKEPLEKLLGSIDAANVDLKSFDPRFYSEICRGGIEPVKRNLRIFYENCHLEITFLIIGGLNDSAEEIDALCRFVRAISGDIPLHLSRFFPSYRFADRPATPAAKMYEAAEIARKYLKNVFIGNMP